MIISANNTNEDETVHISVLDFNEFIHAGPGYNVFCENMLGQQYSERKENLEFIEVL